jgi:glycosyltransferase involved in cell wall biosynthesis
MNKICVIIPTYNNAGSLVEVTEKVLSLNIPLIVVNDGSTDGTEKTLVPLSSKLTLVSYSKNRGKGFALRQGFAKALEQGFEYAVTIDSDGQHDPNDIRLLTETLERTGESLIVGHRNMSIDGVPGKSTFGRRFSNFWFWAETLKKCGDTQSGFRLYPLRCVAKKRFYTNRFEFETEILVRLAWDNVPVREVEVSVVYFPREKRVSHFRPGTDFFRISVLNSILFLAAWLWFLPRLYFLKLKEKTLKEILLNPSESNAKKAQSLAFGVFMGILPIWGFQMIVAFAAAVFLRLNKTLVIIASNISIPPMIPLIVFGSLAFGGLALRTEKTVSFSRELSFRNLGDMALQYAVGSVILAITAGIVTFVLSYLLLKTVRRK